VSAVGVTLWATSRRGTSVPTGVPTTGRGLRPTRATRAALARILAVAFSEAEMGDADVEAATFMVILDSSIANVALAV
jgi:hypothetical protein